jgi:hypothetical protein
MAQINYDGVQRVNPQGADGNNYQRVNANPDAFGAAEAESKGLMARAQGQVAQQIGETAQTVGQIAFKEQGMINEAASTDGETEFLTKSGAIWQGYRGKTGLQAYATRDEAASQVQALRADIEARMPNDNARRAFSLMASRHEAGVLSDISGHSAKEVKTALNQSAQASLDTSVARAGDYTVAASDDRFQDAVHTADFNIATMLQNQGWGPDGGTGMAQNQKTGEITFNDTPEGLQAKAVYEDMKNKAHGAAWENRIRALVDDPYNGSINKADEVYQQNRDKMPPEAQAKIAAYLQPKIRAAQVNTTAAGALASANSGYVSSLTGGPVGIDDAIIQQESGGRAGTGTSVDGAVGVGQVLPSTFKQYAKPGEDINNPKDNEAVSRRIVADYNQRYNGDPARVAVAYFSGPNNVAPAGSPTPWINDAKDGNGKSVSSYVGDVQRRVNGQPGGYQNKANYIRENYADIVAKAEADAERTHPGDLGFQQSVRTRVEQQINDVMQQQSAQDIADQTKLFAAADGSTTNGVKPTSIDALLAVSPEIRRSYESMLMNNPKAAEGLEKLVTANSRGQPNGYGSDFYRFYNEAQSGNYDPMKYARYVDNSPNGALSTAGFNQIKALMERNRSPEGVAVSDAERRFYQSAHSQLTFTNPKTFLHDPKGEENFTKFMQATMPSIQAGLKNGLTPAQLFDPKSPEYVGRSIGMFTRPINQMVQDQINAQTSMRPGEAAMNTGDPGKYDTSKPEGLKAAVAAGAIPRDEAMRIAIERKWIRPAQTEAPRVPAPTFNN